MVDLRSDLPPLNDQERVQIESAFSLIVLKILMSEIAAINRSPREANDYLNKMKLKISNALFVSSNDETIFSKQFEREMYLLNEELFQGIAFERVKK